MSNYWKLIQNKIDRSPPRQYLKNGGRIDYITSQTEKEPVEVKHKPYRYVKWIILNAS